MVEGKPTEIGHLCGCKEPHRTVIPLCFQSLNGNNFGYGFFKVFSEQARKPSGIFGQVVMSAVFDIGNAFSFNKVSSVNTVYFKPQPEFTVRKIFNVLKPDGLLVVAFEDIKQLEQRNLNKDIFHFYSADDLIDLLVKSGFNFHIWEFSN